MNAQLLWLSSLGVGLLALLVLGVQVVVGHLRHTGNLKKQVLRRLNPQTVADTRKKEGIDLGPVENFLIRAGIRMSLTRLVLVLTVTAAIILALAVSRGVLEAVVALVCAVLILMTLWRIKHERLRRQIFEELPGIVDAMLRSLAAGRSVEHSLVIAFGDASPVFDPLNFRLRGAVRQGRDYTRVLDSFAELYRIPPVTQIAIALRTSVHFGSSVRPVLQEVAKAIRSRQELRREFMAATSETRFTAVVFALLPPGLAVYIVLMNKGFAQALLSTDTGHTMVAVAGVLQVLGSILIWNLIREVGRG